MDCLAAMAGPSSRAPEITRPRRHPRPRQRDPPANCSRSEFTFGAKGLTPVDAPLIDAESLFRQPEPLQPLDLRETRELKTARCVRRERTVSPQRGTNQTHESTGGDLALAAVRAARTAQASGGLPQVREAASRRSSPRHHARGATFIERPDERSAEGPALLMLDAAPSEPGQSSVLPHCHRTTLSTTTNLLAPRFPTWMSMGSGSCYCSFGLSGFGSSLSRPSKRASALFSDAFHQLIGGFALTRPRPMVRPSASSRP